MIFWIVCFLLASPCLCAPAGSAYEGSNVNSTDPNQINRWGGGHHHHHGDGDWDGDDWGGSGPLGVAQSCADIWCRKGYHCELQAGSCVLLIFFCPAASPACVQNPPCYPYC